MRENDFIKKVGIPKYKIKEFRDGSMSEGIDWVRGGRGGREVIYTLYGEAKAQAWFDESMSDYCSDCIEEVGDLNIGKVLRIVNRRNILVEIEGRGKVGCFVPLGFKVSIGERVPVRYLEDGGKVSLDIDRVQTEMEFSSVLKRLKASRGR